MAVWIKSPLGGTCCECQPDICGSCCTIDETSFGDQATPGNATCDYNVSGQFVSAGSVLLDFTTSFTGCYARFRVYADSVEKYDTGCVQQVSWATSPAISIPAGTIQISVRVDWGCSGSWVECVWEYALYC